ncbi:MAG: PIN domain nuclease [Solirubrobacterales bacterium]|nr:PIN domain nuclease [Solirubrobacterales bacterium]
MVVVDTSVWVDFLRGVDSDEASVLTNLIVTGQEVALTDLTFTELLQGVKSDDKAKMLSQELKAFSILRLGSLDDFESAATMFRATRNQGKSVRKTIDCLIAAVCVSADAELLHKDVDFDRLADVSDLKILEFGI